MIPHDQDVLDHLEAGQVHGIDAIELAFDSGTVRMLLGVRGKILWDDALGQLRPWIMQKGYWIMSSGFWDDDGVWDDDQPQAGADMLYWDDNGYWRDDRGGPFSPPDAIFYGGGDLASIEVPAQALGPQSEAITARLNETYRVEGSDVPVNIFDDGVRATIDEEPWQGRIARLSLFWLSVNGHVLAREPVALREIDAMRMEWDEQGKPVRVLVLEEPDITQRDIEGKTSNAAFQALIDPTDKAFEHVGTVRNQKINFGKIADQNASGK